MAAAADSVLETLREKIRDEMNAYTDNMASGGCKSYPDYTHQTGIITGLAVAERLLLDLDELLQKA